VLLNVNVCVVDCVADGGGVIVGVSVIDVVVETLVVKEKVCEGVCVADELAVTETVADVLRLVEIVCVAVIEVLTENVWDSVCVPVGGGVTVGVTVGDVVLETVTVSERLCETDAV